MQVTNHPSVEMLERLGGDRFIKAVGAKDFQSADNPQPRLLFRVPRDQTIGRGTHFEISERPNGNYLCVFFKMFKGKRQFVETGEYQKADLRDAFRSITGLEFDL